MELYKYQERVRDLVLGGKSIILQAPTGSGKTRAALTPFLDTFWDGSWQDFPKKGVYIVPMRVLANQFTEETQTQAERYQRKYGREIEVGRQTGEYPDDREFRAHLTFATIDQVLSSWLMVPHSLSARKGNLNAGAFVGSYLIFDEFHLFDPDSTLPTTLQMLKTLNGISPFILMTATFSAEMLEKLAAYLNAEAFLLTEEMLAEIPAQQKERRYHTTAAPMTSKNENNKTLASETAVANILRAHLEQTNDKPRTLVVCNQVERAQVIYTMLRDQNVDGVTVRLLHSRFLRQDRQEIESFVRLEFGKDSDSHSIDSLIVVATQVVEVGLDMSCAVLHTELAPAASVLQRAGRCARYHGESGRVYVYPLDDKAYAPYHGEKAKRQCDLTWEWLCVNQDRHLAFADEQELINYAHTKSDNQILNGVFETEFEWLTAVRSAWRGGKNRGEILRLIRNIQSVSVVIHHDPDQLRDSPFKADSFSLHPGTLRGKYQQWQEANEALDPDFDEGHHGWLVQKLVEDMEDEELQGNRPINYGFKNVASKHDLIAPLYAINPALVGYSTELGLTLYPGDTYESAMPDTAAVQAYQTYSYRLESYFRHIELVHQAFEENSLDAFSAAAHRLEQAYNWHPGIITEMAHLLMAVHDAGKLSQGWQDWAHQWQQTIGKPMANPQDAAAHTDYDPQNPYHIEKNRKMRGKRPNHAVESALASLQFMQALTAGDKDKYQPLLRAAFTAVARHHAPFSSQPGSFQLIPTQQQEIEETMLLLPRQIQAACQGARAHPAIDVTMLPTDFLESNFLLDVRDEIAVCCYMLLVRALRTADQTGTSIGSKS